MCCRICRVRIEPSIPRARQCRLHVCLPSRQHDLDHTDRECICPERSRSRAWDLIYLIYPICLVCLICLICLIYLIYVSIQFVALNSRKDSLSAPAPPRNRVRVPRPSGGRDVAVSGGKDTIARLHGHGSEGFGRSRGEK